MDLGGISADKNGRDVWSVYKKLYINYITYGRYGKNVQWSMEEYNLVSNGCIQVIYIVVKDIFYWSVVWIGSDCRLMIHILVMWSLLAGDDYFSVQFDGDECECVVYSIHAFVLI